MIGKTVGRYRILDEIGGGGMGVVYRAEDVQLQRAVALKFLAPELTRNEEAKRRFLVEARAIAALDHPNVCTVYEVAETEEGRMFLALAYYEGRTLAEWIGEEPLPMRDVVQTGIAIARGLGRAHLAGILHRDVKPANVIVTEHGETKLLDFGLAKLVHDAAQLTQKGTAMGTPAYMAPELIQGDPIDERADLWSLGVLLYEMVTGRRPFRGGTPSAIMMAVLHGDPQPAEELRPDLPRPLRELLNRLLQKDPRRRPATALEVEGALASMASGTQAVPTRPGARRLAVALSVAVLALVALVAWGLRGGSSEAPTDGAAATDANVVAVMPFAVRGSDELAYLREGLVDLLSTKLDGAGALRSVDPFALLGCIDREGEGERIEGARARAIAGDFGAGRYLLGDVLAAGERVQISATLYGIGGDEASRASVEGPVDELFGLVDRLTAELLADLLEGVGRRVDRIATVTTDSLPALKAYLQGEKEFRAGRFQQAIESLQRAVDEDPEFALAWYRLSVAAEWGLRTDLTEVAADQAVRHVDALTDHDRALLEARLANRRGAADEAERLYRAIVSSHPDDVDAWLQLAEVLFHYGPTRGRSIQESRAAYDRVVELDPRMVEAHWHLARLDRLKGDRDALRADVDRILALNPEGDRALEMVVLRDFGYGDAEVEAALLERLADVRDGILALACWNLAGVALELDGARRIAALLTDPARSADGRAMGHVLLGYFALAEGRLDEARAAFEAAREHRPGWSLQHRSLIELFAFVPADEARLRALHAELEAWDAEAEPDSAIPDSFFSASDGKYVLMKTYLLGMVEARLGEASALQRADAMALLPSPRETPSLTADFARSIRAQLARTREGDAAALPYHVEQEMQVLYQYTISSPFFSQMEARYGHALALAASGEVDDALRMASSFLGVSCYDIVFEAPSRLLRARLLDERGDTEAALAHYREAVELWSDCEPVFRPRVEAAERRIAELER